MARKKSKLGEFGGREVIGTGIAIRKAGDGLSAAMKAEPRLLDAGDEVFVVLRCSVVGVNYEAEDRKDPSVGGMRRIHILDASDAAFIEEAAVGEALEHSREIILRYSEQQAGIARLPFGTEENARGEHVLDGHEGRFEDCEICAAEMAKVIDAEAWEEAEKS